MADVFVSALQNYLSGAEWRESVELFVDANCGQFHSIDEPSHEQHGIWRNFQGIVESVLAAALDSVGCSYEALEKALDEVTSIPSRGPRDDVVKGNVILYDTNTTTLFFTLICYRCLGEACGC